MKPRKLLWLLILLSQRFVSGISELCDTLTHWTRNGAFLRYKRCNAPCESWFSHTHYQAEENRLCYSLSTRLLLFYSRVATRMGWNFSCCFPSCVWPDAGRWISDHYLLFVSKRDLAVLPWQTPIYLQELGTCTIKHWRDVTRLPKFCICRITHNLNCLAERWFLLRTFFLFASLPESD